MGTLARAEISNFKKPTDIGKKLKADYMSQQTSFKMCVEVARMLAFDGAFRVDDVCE